MKKQEPEFRGMRNKEPEFQHFVFEHDKTHEQVQFKIGPTPISAMSFQKEVKKALKDLGKDPDMKVWTIMQAWVGPDGCKNPKVVP